MILLCAFLTVVAPEPFLLTTCARGNDGSILAKVWDQTGQLLRFLGTEEPIHSAIFSRNGKYILTTSADGTITILNRTFKEILSGKVAELSGVPFTAFFVHTDDNPTVNVIKESATQSPILFAECLPDRRKILMVRQDGVDLNFIGTDILQRLPTPSDITEFSAEISDDSSEIVLCLGNLVVVYDRRENSNLTVQDQSRILTARRVGNDIKVASLHENTVRTWNFSSATQWRTPMFGLHRGKINSAAFSKDGIYLATASDDKTAKLWFAATGDCLRTFSHEGPVLPCNLPRSKTSIFPHEGPVLTVHFATK